MHLPPSRCWVGDLIVDVRFPHHLAYHIFRAITVSRVKRDAVMLVHLGQTILVAANLDIVRAATTRQFALGVFLQLTAVVTVPGRANGANKRHGARTNDRVAPEVTFPAESATIVIIVKLFVLHLNHGLVGSDNGVLAVIVGVTSVPFHTVAPKRKGDDTLCDFFGRLGFPIVVGHGTTHEGEKNNEDGFHHDLHLDFWLRSC
mmetsp:Transcript_14789/g.28136  ORF Transcript_14789/g.28136 Transcript_14789/m.28136 type:complete len:203 (-) Transcript_14789:323-931(-)